MLTRMRWPGSLERVVRPSETITEHLSRIVPPGEKCHGCPKGDPYGIAGYTGDVFCHLMEEVMPDGNKECAINDDRWSNDPSSATRPTRAFACNQSAMAGFAAAYG